MFTKGSATTEYKFPDSPLHIIGLSIPYTTPIFLPASAKFLM